MLSIDIRRGEDGKTRVYVLGRDWSGLSAGAKIGTVLLFILQAVLGLVQIGLLVAALRDLHRRPAEQVNGDKRVWKLLAFMTPPGPIAYFLFGQRDPKA